MASNFYFLPNLTFPYHSGSIPVNSRPVPVQAAVSLPTAAKPANPLHAARYTQSRYRLTVLKKKRKTRVTRKLNKSDNTIIDNFEHTIFQVFFPITANLTNLLVHIRLFKNSGVNSKQKNIVLTIFFGGRCPKYIHVFGDHRGCPMITKNFLRSYGIPQDPHAKFQPDRYGGSSGSIAYD